MNMRLKPEDIIEFWRQAGENAWFEKDDAFDKQIKDKFGHLPDAIKAGEYEGWQGTPEGMLALILSLDQFPRNMYRGSAQAFAYDECAKNFAKTTIANQWDEAIKKPIKQFLYLPFMHSEDLDDQYFCVELYNKLNDQNGADFARKHIDVIEKFGRFPHRNKSLGRESTKQELAFINTPGTQF